MPSPFRKSLFRYLNDLKANNNRDWFQAHKDRYEDEILEPAQIFIQTMQPRLAKISPQIVASDRRVGGSLMRIYRDVRFSKDKQPYKTNVGIQFRHVAGKDVHAPGYYVHIDSDEVFLGAGIWRPPSDALKAVRAKIDGEPKSWKRVRDASRFKRSWSLGGDSLKRPPRGYTEEHPLIEDLKRKDLIAVCKLPKSAVTRPDFVKDVAVRFADAAGFMRWIADCHDLPF
ncbi:MAG: DUF2461 domain-containing protein [Acidobacteriota bacterium]|nr:DUF2461 domain-containing protein [Acidobacteriota bacterium]MDH3785505.1 DUF2461 domain-containing protein [Acidobacteriota bacterium]